MGPETVDRPRVLILVSIVLLFSANQACRALPFYLVEFGEHAGSEHAMNADLSFGPARYGFLATLAFTLPFAAASLVAGVLADGVDRLWFNATAGLLWSACTATMACSSTYVGLLTERWLLGGAQAATNPASLSVLAELFPSSRATVSSVFGLGIYFGGGLASLGAALNQRYGWRSTSLVFGVASAFASFPLLFFSDPRRRRTPSRREGRLHDATRFGELCASSGGLCVGLLDMLPCSDALVAALKLAPALLRDRMAEAVSTPQALWLYVAATLRFCAGFSILVWLPAAIAARFPGHMGRFAVLNCLIKAFVGGASSLAGGIAADAIAAWLGRAGFNVEWSGAAFCALASLAAAPLWMLVLWEGLSFEASMACLLAEYLVAESWLGPAVAALQAVVPPERRGAAQGAFSSLTAFGNALPWALGFLPTSELPGGLRVSVALCYVASACCFARAAVAAHSPTNAPAILQVEAV